MKTLMATAAILCLSSTVLAHDIYSNLRDRDGHYCCNGQDCRPAQATVLPNGSYYYRRLTKSFRPIGQHHHLMIASTIALIIQWPMSLIRGVNQYGVKHL